jgi:hypothetical protein
MSAMIAHRTSRARPFVVRREQSMTLIAGIRSEGGIILAADTEEQIPGALKASGEKIHLINSPFSDWTIVLAGAGHVDYVLMARDLIQEKVYGGSGKDQQIIDAIRESVQEVWGDYATHESGVGLSLLIGSYSSDRVIRFTVVSGAAVRSGRNIEAMGIGDATFRSLADRYLGGSPLSYLPGDCEAMVAFIVYAALQAKLSVPGVGGMTRIVRVCPNGTIKWEKSFKIIAIQNFFYKMDENVRRHCFRSFALDKIEPERLLKSFNQATLRAFRHLRKEVKSIDNDPTLA